MILVLLMLTAVKGYSVEKYFYAPSPQSFWNAGSWGGTRPSAGDNLHISGTCIMDVTTGIDYGNLFLNDCNLAGNLLFTNENHTLSVNQVIVPAGACAGINLFHGGFLRIRGSLNIANPNIIIEGAGALEFYTGSVLPNYINTYKNLSIVTDYGLVRLAVPTTVQKKLFLRGAFGILELRSNDLTIGQGGIIVGVDVNHYIHAGGTGKLIRYVDSSDVLFPFGYKGSSYEVNNFLTIKNSGIPDWFAVRSEGSFINTLMPNNCIVREWSITEDTPGGSDASLTFSWDNYSEVNNFNLNNRLAIARYDSSKWKETNSSKVFISSSLYSTTANNFTSFGYFCVKNKSKIICNLNTIPEGFYNQVLNNLNRKDTIITYLRNNSPPYNIIDSAKNILDSNNFTVRDSFYNAPTGNYYMVLKHRNSLETWSKTGGESFAIDSIYSYDFTSSPSQAFGSNLILVGSKYCLYSGDVNQDGIVDASDLAEVENAAGITLTGYSNTDINGDNIVDAGDISIADNNVTASVHSITPLLGESINASPFINRKDNEVKKDKSLNKIETENSKPNAFALGDNYPNPFNPTTKINYELPENANVSLKVFDITGKEVASLVNGNQNAGKYTVAWNASQYSSGIYFYKIVAKDFVKVKKMTLVK